MVGCEGCSDSTTCTTCATNYFLNNSECISCSIATTTVQNNTT